MASETEVALKIEIMLQINERLYLTGLIGQTLYEQAILNRTYRSNIIRTGENKNPKKLAGLTAPLIFSAAGPQEARDPELFVQIRRAENVLCFP